MKQQGNSAIIMIFKTIDQRMDVKVINEEGQITSQDGERMPGSQVFELLLAGKPVVNLF
jgi:hypothetical protein